MRQLCWAQVWLVRLTREDLHLTDVHAQLGFDGVCVPLQPDIAPSDGTLTAQLLVLPDSTVKLGAQMVVVKVLGVVTNHHLDVTVPHVCNRYTIVLRHMLVVPEVY